MGDQATYPSTFYSRRRAEDFLTPDIPSGSEVEDYAEADDPDEDETRHPPIKDYGKVVPDSDIELDDDSEFLSKRTVCKKGKTIQIESNKSCKTHNTN